MNLYCCHNLLTGNNHFYYSHNLEGLEMKLQTIPSRVEDNLKNSGYVKGLEIIILAHFVEKKDNF